MYFDPLTLMTVGSFITGISAALMFGAWAQLRAPALAWWAAASLIYCISIAFLAVGVGTGSAAASIIGGGASTLTPVLVWAGARRFHHLRQKWLLLFAGPALWLVVGAVQATGTVQGPATFASFVVWVAYLAAAAVEFWRGRDEQLTARFPLMGFLILHAFIFLGGVVDILIGTYPLGVEVAFSTWFSFIHFETLIYAVGTAVFMVLICKERSERRHIIAARHDTLTGAANRGIFLEGSERLLRRCQSEGISFSMIMFDLDHFKRINDTHGHDVGDEVIRAFADTARTVLRPTDLFGRYGGEEFTVALPGATIEAAYVIAERVRFKFAESHLSAGGQPLHPTVSAGVASATSATTVEAILRAADQSMYRAKSLGRNRVERVARDLVEDAPSVIRIA